MGMDTNEFLFRLTEWKKNNGKKDVDFCREMDIHKNTLLKWKHGDAAPQAKHIKKICDLFDITEADLDPHSFFTAQDNENKLYYRSQQLQRYARDKGLDEDFYKQIIGKPYFMREFPFSSVESRFHRLRCPKNYDEDEEYIAALNSIPLKKYEFKDDYGNIVMLAEADIDFMVNLQKMGEQLIRDQLYLEKHRQEEKRLRDWATHIAANCLEDGVDMDPNKLYEYVTKPNVEQRYLYGDALWERFKEYCKTHNVREKPFRQIMFESVEDRHPPMTEEERQAWKEHGIRAGMTEEEMDDIFKDQEFRRQYIIELEKKIYKSDNKGSDNNGEH